MLIFPAQSGFAVFAVNVCNRMQSCQQHPLLGRPAAHINYGIKEVCSPLTSLERLGNEFVMIGQVSSAVNAAVGPVARGQVCLKSLGSRHLHHWCY